MGRDDLPMGSEPAREPARPSRMPSRPARLGSPIREPWYMTYVKRGRKRLLISDVQSGRPDGRSTIWVKGAMVFRHFFAQLTVAMRMPTILSWKDKHAEILPVSIGKTDKAVKFQLQNVPGRLGIWILCPWASQSPNRINALKVFKFQISPHVCIAIKDELQSSMNVCQQISSAFLLLHCSLHKCSQKRKRTCLRDALVSENTRLAAKHANTFHPARESGSPSITESVCAMRLTFPVLGDLNRCSTCLQLWLWILIESSCS
ncbi:hypothetical protein L596_008866 [Steinernema carpocapsae]|uniref:Uncharacterized protein n=1 Tax=Steinernema carpocapsae TaxID=34508 RepID=A0A4U5PE91_STECR|nr:hypothetical protein L596_008866 [Steinernema carpocapsae]